MRRTVIAAYFFTIASLLVLAGFSQNKAFEGHVLFEDGTHVPFAEIKIYDNKSNDLIAAQVTDIYGHFQISPLAEGNYRLEFAYVGHADAVKSVVVSQVGSARLGAIELFPNPEFEQFAITPGNNTNLSS